jgi:hypothetical protein
MSDQRSWASMIRADMIVAVCALLISSLACAAAVLQTRVIGQQLSATVWPYLDYSTSTSNNTGNAGPRVQDETTISVTNDGLGPAIIKQAGVTIDRHRLPALDAAITAFVPNRKRISGSTSVSNITVGSVIRPGQTIVLMDVKGIGFARPVREHLSHIDIPICYCSLLQTCWIVHITVAPREVASCA